jgi:hypothetical protein
VSDTQILASGSAGAPEAYTVPPSQEIIVKAVSCTLDGTGASGVFYPMLSIIPPGGVGAIECPMLTSVAAGESAEVSWFPGGLGSSSLPLYQDYTPVVTFTGVPLTDPVITYCAAWVQLEVNSLVAGGAIISLGSDIGTGPGPYQFDPIPHPFVVQGFDLYPVYTGFGSCALGAVGHELPAYVDGLGRVYAFDGTTWDLTTSTFPGAWASGDVIFNGSWFGRLVHE